MSAAASRSTSAVRRRPAATVAALGAAALLAGCGEAAGAATPGTGSGTTAVLASFYPLQYVVEQVGGEHVSVDSLTPPGAEPHDLELSPRQVRRVAEADVVVVLGGFQPAVDEAVAARTPEHLVDAAQVPEVAEHVGGEDEHAGETAEEHAEHAGEDEESADEHADDEHAGETAEEHAEHAEEEPAEDGAVVDDGHGHGAADPHFWLNPTLLAAVGLEVADALAAADPEHADDYAANAAALEADLTALDEEYAAGLASCERDVIVTAHAAFGHLTERYGLEQVGISGLDPDTEPSPARLREIRDVATEHDVTTIFTEALLDPAVAETLAADLGLETAVLDPVESRTSADADYRDVMDANLEALRAALGCA